MSAYKKTRITFDDLPLLMVELLDQIKVLNDRIHFMEGTMAARLTPDKDRELLTTSEVCKMLKVARITVYRMANRGDIPCYRNGKSLMFYKDEIQEWINSSRTNDHLLAVKTAEDYLNSSRFM